MRLEAKLAANSLAYEDEEDLRELVETICEKFSGDELVEVLCAGILHREDLAKGEVEA